ncbi:MAG: hypothetical protein D6733_03650 [Methanobacteriota archaeon]|nr:MAG: hypothetical protein D6733_03650 [Euryarchaeota archaeon]
MPVISLRIDEKTKRKMSRLKHINWSQVIREGILQKIEEEEKRRIDRALLSQAVKENDRLKRKVPGYDSTLEIRKWREARR